MLNRINGRVAEPWMMKKYKEKKTGVLNLDYGDYKQFVPEQIVYQVTKPDVDICFEKEVVKIEVLNKKIHFLDGDIIKYDCLINTIPLNYFLRILDLWELGPLKNMSLQFLRNRPIYYAEEGSDRKDQFPSAVLIWDYQAKDDNQFYRICKTSNMFAYESYIQFEGAIKILPGKIISSAYSEEIAKDLQLYNIYCYGRHARWRPKEHIHETFKNLRRFKERKGQVGYV